MKLFDFGAFQKIMKMLSHNKILFHKLFGAFHDTPCNNFWSIIGLPIIVNIKQNFERVMKIDFRTNPRYLLYVLL